MIKEEIIFRTKSDGNYFFGYYDKSPINLSNDKHLALYTDFNDRLPDKNDHAVIGYFRFDKRSNDFVPLTQTKTFNWQQGCMLQWLGPDYQSKIIYNDFLNGKYRSVVLDVRSGLKEILPMAIYTIHPSGKYALCIDNERHYWCRRGYSYDGIKNLKKKQNIVEGDGIFLMDIEKGKIETIIKINDIVSSNFESSMTSGPNYLEHMMFNKNGSRFGFFHRWVTPDKGIYSRLYTANIDGSDLFLLNDSGRMSHYCWQGENMIFGWGAEENVINRLRKYNYVTKNVFKRLKPVYRKIIKGNPIDGTTNISKIFTGDCYFFCEDKTKKIKKISIKLLDRNGHPSFSNYNENVLVTDTYPDSKAKARLILVNTKKNNILFYDELNSIGKYDNSNIRCDLHPKWSMDGRFVSIDTMNDGCRSMYVYDVSKYL